MNVEEAITAMLIKQRKDNHRDFGRKNSPHQKYFAPPKRKKRPSVPYRPICT